MAQFLAYTSPARGHLYPAVAILLELRRRGHAVAVRTLAEEVPRMRALGLDADPIEPRIEGIAHDDWQVRGARRQLARTAATFAARAGLEVSDLRTAIAQTRPDAVLVDVNCWGAMAAAEAWGGGWAAFSPFPLPLSSCDAPPFGPGFAPARGWPGRLRDSVVRPLVLGAVMRTTLPRINAVRTPLGLPALTSADDIYLRSRLVLSLTAEPFEYPRRDWPDSVVLVGPCTWEPASEPPEWLAGVSAPLLLVTTSSEYQDDARLVRAALAGLADEDVFVVATLPAAEPNGLVVPANARVERFVPHGPVLARASCAVTHGGMGATQKALALGVPVCAVPFGRDQLEVARRVEVAGAGTRLSARRLTPRRLNGAVRAAMSCRDGARATASALAAAGGPTRAADLVESRIL